MVLDLLRSIIAQSFYWLALYQRVYEISCFVGPPGRHLGVLDLHLVGQDAVTDFLATTPVVRATAEHALVSDDAEGVIVDADPVILLAHDLRCHVTRGTTGLVFVVLGPNTGDAEVCHF